MQPSASDESLRSLLLRQSNDLRALQEFSELERECFDKQLAETKRLNEQYLAKINELMKERENSINSSNISGTNSSVKQIESISDERKLHENSLKLKETQASLQRMSENFNCLRSLCLQDLTMRDADPKRLLAEAARQLAVIESDPMAL